ncbi:MAG: hypothetical protein AB7U73_10875 [Pirellulales bacterium]
MPARKLSSDIQGLFSLFVIGFCILSASMTAVFAVQAPNWRNLGLIPGLLFFGALLWYFASLKRVVAQDDDLAVRDLFRSELISYENVSRVRVFQARTAVFVTLFLRSPGRFGSKVRFLTNMRFARAQDHPDVIWLRQRCGFTPQPKSAWWHLLALFISVRDYA